ncbi:GAF domain-containing protein [Trichocoleus sp. FACHB-591]|uniref:ATP-binding protein n=1 Tax=Trichocoleus sp. FACHB-591 TaxID=2692872 RepID=UPI0016824083|nr:ATP-binding protein [Trichocoleus sp. FACHB-591]MBD2098133.1 GAF domain-containing protein [Trichocoleus sp. FACHB-591]
MNFLKFSTLRSKLIFSLLGVALLPILILALLNQRSTQKALTNNANLALLGAASQTALSLDSFIKTNLDAVRVEAQLPILAKYLSLPAVQRTAMRTEVETTLLALGRKDTLNILSYALLDAQGQNVIDTYTVNIGNSETDRPYFQQPFKTGLPYVSPIQYSASDRVASLYFTSPIRNALGKTIGILRVRYNANAIQRLVAQNSALVAGGKGSFAILLDENQVRLAQGYAPELVFKSVTPLPAAKVKALQAAGRLPQGTPAELATNLPAFEQGLKNTNQSAFFTTPLVVNSDELNSAAVTKLKTQPWSVVFVESQSLFLGPIQAQIRATLLLAIAIAVLVAAAAITLSELLTKPLIGLTSIVTSFTAGDLKARSTIQTEDEIGVLAGSFNQMAEQVGKLLQNLEERTQELEVSQQVTGAVTELSRVVLDPKRLLREAIALMQSRFNLHYIQIYLLNPDKQVLYKEVESSQEDITRLGQPTRIALDDDESLIATAARTQEIICVDQAHSNPEVKGVYSATLGSEVVVPLVTRGSLLGVLNIEDKQSDRFSPMDLETFNTLAGQIATALDNARLFAEVQKTSTELQEKAQELEQTLRELQQTQAQVVQSEKMSSLGQLVAGIAHEINNPVNFIYGNLNYAGEYIQDLTGVLKLYQRQFPHPTPEIAEEIEAIDLDFLLADLPKLLASMKVGADRIQKIVLSLRNFSRMDEAEMKAVDIHEGIDSTLMILQNRLKAKSDRPEIAVVKDYGNLPLVECYAGQLNQVFMNLLSNAIDALEDSQTPASEPPQTPTIAIHTRQLGSQSVEIRIADNGPGIAKADQRRLFDPFFTTKPIGKGTGLGLSISYQIVTDKHGGVLHCNSAPGKGTEFLIEIPLRQT